MATRAGVAQLVERNVANVEVASSRLVSRFLDHVRFRLIHDKPGGCLAPPRPPARQAGARQHLPAPAEGSAARAGMGPSANFLFRQGDPPKVFLAFTDGAQLSPDGTRIATASASDQQTGARATLLFDHEGDSVIAREASPQGWIDNRHLVVGSAWYVSIVDISSGAAAPMWNLITIPRQRIPSLAGVLPQDLA